jgi:uncharacterized protein
MAMARRVISAWLLAAGLALLAQAEALAQTPPSAGEIARYTGLHGVAASGAVSSIREMTANGLDTEIRDGNGRTPLHVAAFLRQRGAMRELVTGGANPNALDSQRYDVVTIAAAADDPETMSLAISLGNSASNVTSIYDGTALIAAAHLGHDEVVRRLIAAGAPVDHINNLGWTALIEAIILGDGGARHLACVQALVTGRANPNIADRSGVTPLAHARRRGYSAMAGLIRQAGGK